MTTTELIKLLKSVEYGSSGRAREISIEIGEDYISEPEFKISSTGDGIAGAQLTLSIKGNRKEEHNLNIGDDVMNTVTGKQYKIIGVNREEGIVIGENEHETRAFGDKLTYRITCLTKVMK